MAFTPPSLDSIEEPKSDSGFNPPPLESEETRQEGQQPWYKRLGSYIKSKEINSDAAPLSLGTGMGSLADFQLTAGSSPEALAASRGIQKGTLTGIERGSEAVPAALADIGTGQFKNVPAALRGETPEYRLLYRQPYQPKALQYGGEASADVLAMAPKLAATALSGEAAPITGAALFGFNKDLEYEPKQVAINAALPFLGKFSGGIAGRVASKLGITGETAQNLIKAGGGYAAANAVLAAQVLPQWKRMNDEQKQEAVGNIIANGFLGLTSFEGVRGKGTGKIDLTNEQKAKDVIDLTEGDIHGPVKRGLYDILAARGQHLGPQMPERLPIEESQPAKGEDNSKQAIERIMDKYKLNREQAVEIYKKSRDFHFGPPKQPAQILSPGLEAVAKKVADPNAGPLTVDENKLLSQVGDQQKQVYLNRVAELRKGGEQNASKEQKAAEVHGNVPAQPAPRAGEVPKPVSGGGIQPQASGGLQKAEEIANHPIDQPFPAPTGTSHTSDALEFGSKMDPKRPEDLAKLKALAERARAGSVAAQETLRKDPSDQNFNTFQIAHAKVHWLDEAIHGATGAVGDLEMKQLGADYKPPFPKTTPEDFGFTKMPTGNLHFKQSGAGRIAVDFSNPDHIEISVVNVNKEAQGKGTGSALVEDVKKVSDATGKPIRLVAKADPARQARLNKFYEKAGFNKIGEDDGNPIYEYKPGQKEVTPVEKEKGQEKEGVLTPSPGELPNDLGKLRELRKQLIDRQNEVQAAEEKLTKGTVLEGQSRYSQLAPIYDALANVNTKILELGGTIEDTPPRHKFLTDIWGAQEPSSAKETGWVLRSSQLKKENITPEQADKDIQDALDAGVDPKKIEAALKKRTKARTALQAVRFLIPRAPGGAVIPATPPQLTPEQAAKNALGLRIQDLEHDYLVKKGFAIGALENFRKGKDINSEEYAKALEDAINEPSDQPPPPPPQPPTPGSLPTAPPEAGPGTGEGPGGAPYGFTGDPALKQLADSVQSMADANPGKVQLRRAYTLGERWDQLKADWKRALTGLVAARGAAFDVLRGKPIVTSWKDAIGKNDATMTEVVQNQRKYRLNNLKAVPNYVRRGGISAWIGTGGDDAQLAIMEQQAPAKYKPYFTAARNLTPDEKVIAQNHQLAFEGWLKEAQEAGLLANAVENYLHRIYPDAVDFTNRIINELGSGIYTGRPGFAKQRVYRTDFDAMMAGLNPEMDYTLRTAAYDHALNKAIADRQMVKDMMQIKAQDGRPIFDVAGGAQAVEGPEGDESLMVKPAHKSAFSGRVGKDNPEAARLNFRGDYKRKDYAALRRWRWVDTDENGKDTLVQGDVLIHPDWVGKVENLFEPSKIRKGRILGIPVGRAGLTLSNTVKQTALDLSLFHPVQLTVHGLEHRVFEPYNNWTAKALGMEVTPIDMQDPTTRGLVEHGLQLVDHNNSELFSEGLSGSSLTRHIPYIGEKVQAMNDWLFHDWIPRLKLKMAMHALNRNRENFPELSEPELMELTANQANAAFGELNWRRMGVSRTTQDVLRLALLAPDFLIARGKYSAQAFQAGIPRRLPGGGFGAGFGREQATAMLLFGALSNYILARILNKWDNGNYHFELENAFSVVHKSKAYSLRTAHGDLLHMVTDFPGFWYNRLNPTFARTGIEFLTRRDQFGRKRTNMEQLQDLGSMVVPISGRGILHPREQSLLESFANAMGITEHRSTSIDNIYRLAENFKKQHNIAEPAERIYNADRDPYRGIKLAALYRSPEEVAVELDRAFKARVTDKQKLYDHFKEYARRPFSGSKAREQEFYNSLDEDEKGLYKEAWKERQKMIDNLSKGWALYVQKRANSP